MTNVIQASHAVKFEKVQPVWSQEPSRVDFMIIEFNASGIQDCDASFTYQGNRGVESAYFTEYDAGDALRVDLNCSGGSQAEYFPVVH
jgi:hypothetical protein